MDIEWIEAAPIVVDELLASSARSALWLLLARLRKLDAPQVPRLDVSTRIEELLDRLSQIDSAASLRWRSQWQLLRARPGPDLSTARAVSQMGVCLVHGDLHSGNVLRRADGGLVCVDWEYAHTGDPLEDLAGLLSGSALLQAEWRTAQDVSAPRPDWWPADVFDELACHGHAEQVRVLDWWVEARRLLDGVWMTLAAHSAGNTPRA
jgi:thiamine kinase-like enzyme